MTELASIDPWAGLEALRPDLRAYLARRCRVAEAEEVIQESLIRAARFRDRLQHESALRAWVRRIAANVLADRARKRRREQLLASELRGMDELCSDLPDPCSYDEPADLRLGDWVVDRQQALRLLDEELRGLSFDDQALLGRHYAGASACRESADPVLFGSLAKSRLYRARRRLLRAMRRRLRSETEGVP